jgi:NAD(P)-dependent dehydrogenase (short-subunit alcohol dehydrogenase family)
MVCISERVKMALDNAKTVLLTGVTRGLGRAMADKFIALGHIVCGCGRSAVGIQELQKRHGEPHEFAVVDVAQDVAVKSWAERVLSGYGPPELLLNNAALINRNAPLWTLSREEFDQVIDVNIKGVVNVIRHFVPAMIEQKRGVIVNFSSGWGRSTAPEVAPYCATKYAIEGLSKALAQELPKGMAAIPFNPGIIDTDMLRSTFAGDASRYPAPVEWARVAVPFLLTLGPQHNGKSVSVPD